MREDNSLKRLKQSFQSVIPKQDRRTRIPHLDFIAGLVFSFLGDTKSFSIESLRRSLIKISGISICKSTFWERLSRKRLNTLLSELLAQLIRRTSSLAICGQEIVSKLKVDGVYLTDSSSITLWDGAMESYPGTRTNAGLKWHACYDLLSGKMQWYEITSCSVHDRKCFPSVRSLGRKLIIFDLGYWDYGLLIAIDLASGFFLSRVKSNAAIMIKEVIKGTPKTAVGKKLSALKYSTINRNIIELRGLIAHKKETRIYRVIGFWNKSERKYHWYITNLAVDASVIYTLYRVRWQIELIFKGFKRSFNLDQRLTSNNDNIIESLLLSSLIASFAAQLTMNVGVAYLNEDEKSAFSFQRIAGIVVLLATDFFNYLVYSSTKYAKTLMIQIRLFATEMFDKNYKHRPTSLRRLKNQIAVA